jgi:hypothetical protein
MSSVKGVRFFPPLPGRFIHGVDLEDWYPCWNLALSGRLYSPDFAASLNPNLADSHRAIRDVPIEELRAGLPVGTPTPRAVWQLGAAAIVRSGGKVGIGVNHTQWCSPERADQLRASGDVELAFEAGRRQFRPEAPSRLSCLYLAEDSDSGRAHVRAMLGPGIHLLRVAIPWVARVARVDTAWFDAYCRHPDPIFVQNYWQAVPKNPSSSTWEILLDGGIQVDDPEGLKHLKSQGAHLDYDRAGLFQKAVAAH